MLSVKIEALILPKSFKAPTYVQLGTKV